MLFEWSVFLVAKNGVGGWVRDLCPRCLRPGRCVQRNEHRNLVFARSRYNRGDTVLHKGQDEDKMWFVIRGTLETDDEFGIRVRRPPLFL